MRQSIQEAGKMLREMNPISQAFFRMGLYCIPILYLSAAVLHWISFSFNCYLTLSEWYYGCLEIAPAVGLAAFSAAFLIDIELEKEIGVHKK
nr:hypothetical protein [uncultured Solibaculum sp.]